MQATVFVCIKFAEMLAEIGSILGDIWHNDICKIACSIFGIFFNKLRHVLSAFCLADDNNECVIFEQSL